VVRVTNRVTSGLLRAARSPNRRPASGDETTGAAHDLHDRTLPALPRSAGAVRGRRGRARLDHRMIIQREKASRAPGQTLGNGLSVRGDRPKGDHRENPRIRYRASPDAARTVSMLGSRSRFPTAGHELIVLALSTGECQLKGVQNGYVGAGGTV
jgi:hypothetical protein